ncbi:MAG: ATP-binding protein, partial [Desulfobacterales bacterium]
ETLDCLEAPVPKKRPLVWQIYPYVTGVVLVCLTAATVFMSVTMRRFNVERVAAHLERTAKLIEKTISDPLAEGDLESVQRICREAGSASGIRATVILSSGRVIGDSFNDPREMENHSDRPEVKTAVNGSVGTSTRFSTTLTQRMIYVAIPLFQNGKVAGTLRTSVSASSIDDELRSIQRRIIVGALAIALAILPISLMVAKRISRPVEELTRGADRFSSGDLGHRLPIPTSEEMATLAESMNQMAEKLESRIQTIVRQRSDLEALLSSMTEGVLAIDQSEKVVFGNRAVERLLNTGKGLLVGRSLQEIIRSPEFEKLVQNALATAKTVQGDITLFLDRERSLRVHGAPLLDGENRHVGTLFVLDDVTRLKSLETIRKEFAANVSHELKTPITAIKGFVETLIDDGHLDPDESRRFLAIIQRHVERLIAILEDLISLSHIEQRVEADDIERQTSPLLPIIDRSVAVCREKADRKGIRIHTECQASLTGTINTLMVERALSNLIDNAINYTEAGGTIRVGARTDGQDLVLQVEDNGIGIPAKHQSRLFERFYRVDKARSRNSGGTGLGLAIVKHIALAHGGQVTVESTPGQGSRFDIRLPLKPHTSR